MTQKFFYKAINSSGQKEEGVLEESSRSVAIEKLHQKGIIPISIVRLKKPFKLDFSSFFSNKKNSKNHKHSLHRKHVLIFTESCNTFIRSGFSIDQAILAVHKTAEKKDPLKNFSLDIVNHLREGIALSKALKDTSTAFSPLYVNLILAGEKSGQISSIFEQLSLFLKEQDNFRRTIKIILFYPLIIVTISIVSIGIILGFVIPQFIKIFDDFNQELPVITQVIVKLSDIFRKYFFVKERFLILLASMVGLFFLFRKKVFWKNFIKNFVIKLPYVGTINKKIILASFCSTLAMLLKGGITLVPAFTYAEKTVTLEKISTALKSVKEKVKKGVSLHQAMMEYSDIFPQVLVMTLSVGEKTGQLENSLNHIAEIFQDDVNKQSKIITSVLSPILILGIGIVIAFFIIGLLLPLIKATDIGSVS